MKECWEVKINKKTTIIIVVKVQSKAMTRQYTCVAYLIDIDQFASPMLSTMLALIKSD